MPLQTFVLLVCSDITPQMSTRYKEGGGGGVGVGKHNFFSFKICDRAPVDKQVKNRLKSDLACQILRFTCND